MPYKTIDELPSQVKTAVPSSDGQTMFMRVVNAQLAAGKQEDVAFASAWSALQRAGYSKGEDGTWIKKGYESEEEEAPEEEVGGDVFDRVSYKIAELLRSVFASKPDTSEGVVIEDSKEGDKEHLCKMGGKFIKVDADKRIVWGWASVVTKDGKAVVDSQGDTITADEMVAMADEFMTDVRLGKAMHEGKQVGTFIHSFPMTKEIAKAFGIETKNEGWIVAMKVNDDHTWGLVKAGKLPAFSIGGRALSREMIDG